VLADAGVKFTEKPEEAPGAKLSGMVRPDIVNVLPGNEAAETERLAVPVFLMVIVCVLVTPTETLLKLTLDGVTLIAGCTPAPESAMVAGELVAVLTTVRLPVTLPTAVGAKLTLSDRLLPAARETDPDKPLTANSLPEIAADETVTAPVPVFVTVTDCEAELPTSVFAKLRLLVLLESKYVGAGAADFPVPLTGTEIVTSSPSQYLMATAMLPL